MSTYQRLVEKIAENMRQVLSPVSSLAPPPTTIEAHCEASEKARHEGADSVLDWAFEEQKRKNSDKAT